MELRVKIFGTFFLIKFLHNNFKVDMRSNIFLCLITNKISKGEVSSRVATRNFLFFFIFSARFYAF